LPCARDQTDCRTGRPGVSADAFVTLPVSLAGKEGVDELVQQTRGLFNMESPEAEVFPLQIAFNLVTDARRGKAISQILRIAVNTKPQLGWQRGLWSNSAQRPAPLFFGAAMALHARTRQPLEIESP
jgi:aspartate-semialdehyde dehydrogenase